MERPIYNTPTPTCVTKDVQIIVCGKRELLKKSAKELSDEYQCKFQFVFSIYLIISKQPCFAASQH